MIVFAKLFLRREEAAVSYHRDSAVALRNTCHRSLKKWCITFQGGAKIVIESFFVE